MEEEKEVMVEAWLRGKGVEQGAAAVPDSGVCKSQLKSCSPPPVVKESCHISFHQGLMC